MAPAPAPAMDVEEEGGGAAKNQNNVVVIKSEDVSTGGIKDGGAVPVVVNPESVNDEGGDTTECSSSFGDTCSGFDDEAAGAEPEVNSHILAPANGGLASRLPRRKKVTAEWRNAVRPILWRCQWLELRMKDLSSQVLKYDRELALIKKEKELQQAVSTTSGSMPEPMQIRIVHGNSSMKRRKRKRHEDTVDTSLYINKHQILSYYYDKQNKGAEADGLLVDDCSSPVDRSITGGLDAAALLDAEEYDMIFEQLTLKDILLTIDGVQSQVNLLQDRLSKAHLEEETLAFSEDNTHVRVPRKRHSTQKRSFSYSKNYRHTKPQKKKNLNILLKDDDGPALAARPAWSHRETNGRMEDAKGNTEGKCVELNRSRDRAITVGLLLGADNSLPNGHMGEESTDDVLIDNQAANEVKLLPSETSAKGQNNSAPVEVKNTSAPVKVDDICPLKVDNISAPMAKQELFLEKSPVMKPVCPGKKQGQKAKKKKKGGGSASSTKQESKEASETSAGKQKSDSTASDAAELEIMTPLSAWKKRKTVDSALKKQKTGKSSSAAKEQKTDKSSPPAKRQEAENSSSAAKKQKTENSSSAAKKQEAENLSPAAKQETESTPSKLKIEKAVLVAVNSRRSQRVRKPKVFTE